MKSLRTLVVLIFAVMAAGPALPSQSIYGPVITKSGVRVKLITTRPCQIYEKPDETSKSAPVRSFQFYYVLPPDPNATSNRIEDVGSLTKAGFYRVAVGVQESEYRGWVHEGVVVEWHHREALKFARRKGRGLAHFFPGVAEAKAYAGTGKTDKATHREPESAGGALMLMPLLARQSVTVDQQEMEAFKIAFMAQKVGAKPVPHTNPANASASGKESPVLTKQMLRKKSTVDITFVIDTTASMEDAIQQVLKSVKAVTKGLASNSEMLKKLRFGLVAYRDTVPDMGPSGMEFLTSVVCDLEQGADHTLFQKRLAGLKVANVGSGDYAEDVLAGVYRAMDLNQVKWNPFAWKLIVIIGDSSMKGPDHPIRDCQENEAGRSLADIKAQAQPGTGAVTEQLAANFVLSAVRILDPEAVPDHATGDQQFNTLCHGRQYTGEVISVRGGTNPEDFSQELIGKLRRQIENHHGAVVQGKKPNTVGKPKAGTRVGEFPTPVLELLRLLPDEKGDAENMMFRQRFCSEFDSEGNRLFIPHVFCRKGSLKTFRSFLDYVQQVLRELGEPGSRDVQKLVSNIKMASTGLLTAEGIKPNMPLNELISAMAGFPLKTKIFHVTPEKLASMSQTDYDDWVKGVKVCSDTLRSLVDNPHIWLQLDPNVQEGENYAFIPLTDLP